MLHFDITRSSKIDRTFRVAKIQSDFDYTAEQTNESFKGTLSLPDKWNIGLIVGGSGTGKSTIAKELFGKQLITSFAYTSKSVIDDMPRDKTVEEIVRTFYSVGFGSVPSWLKPYGVLSNGERMRVDLARAILEHDFFVFDEFTSVIDREVAKTACIALHKAMKQNNKQFVAVTCHHDVIEYLQPDWVFDTDTMQMLFQYPRGHDNNSSSEDVTVGSGENLSVITI